MALIQAARQAFRHLLSGGAGRSRGANENALHGLRIGEWRPCSRCIRTVTAFISASVVFAADVASAHQAIQVAPNVLVSRDGQSPKVEFHLAAHPRNSSILLGTAIVFEPEATCRLYLSFDGGWSWQSRDFPELREQGCTDPQVAFGESGVAYFAVMTFLRNELNQKRSLVSVYRSVDEGRSWDVPVYVGLGDYPDHPQVAVRSRAAEPDVVFISVNVGGGVALYRSEDGGRTFSSPQVAVSKSGRAIFNINLLVLSDGTIIVPYTDADLSDPAKLTTLNIFVTTSRDGSRTFSEPRLVARQRRAPENPHSIKSLPIVFGADVRSQGFRNRLYCVWIDFETGRARLLYSVSADGGNVWGRARTVLPEVPGSSDQFRPAIAVAPNGAVGVSWFDSRHGKETYAQYLAASVDGGDSFLPAVQVSSEPSPVDASGNRLVRPSPNSPSVSAQGDHFFVLDSVRSTFPDGGDYVGLAADADNVFHPLWPDARTGSYQVWTARVAIGSNQQTQARAGTAEFLNRALRLVFDPISLTTTSGMWEIPIRIKNISTVPICGPVFVVVVGTMYDSESPTIVNSSNSKSWSGAAFDYSRAFGDLRCLGSGEISNPILWRLRPVQKYLDARIPTFFRIKFSSTGVLQE